MPSACHVVDLDLHAVGVDLSAVPIEDVLAFRERHAESYRRYARDLRSFLRELAAIPEEERAQALADRQADLLDQAARLDALSREWWKRPSRLLLSLSGAAWSVVTGDALGGLLAGGAGAADAIPDGGGGPEALSYLFRAADRDSW